MRDFGQTRTVLVQAGRSRRRNGLGLAILLGLPLLANADAVADGSAVPRPGDSTPPVVRHEPIRPLPQRVAGLDIEQVLLGERLFHDPRLSSDLSVSCANCHPVPTAGADGRPVSFGVGGRAGQLNSPTVFNAAYNLSQFWNGRAADLAEQIDGPLHNEVELANDWGSVIAALAQDAPLSARFEKLYGRPWDVAGIKAAIVAYERSLTTPNSPFDRYLRGEATLTAAQSRGYALFKSYGCIACHQGVNVGGNMYARLGSIVNFYIDGRQATDADLGRFKVTGDPEDKYVFKVPSLRLAVSTAPYFHDGSIATLEEAITLMGHYQLGRRIPAADVEALIAFLESLQGDYQRLSR